jgi:hypothetical protein
MGTTTAWAQSASLFKLVRPNLVGEHQLGRAVTNGLFVDIWAKSTGPIWYEGLSTLVGLLGKGGNFHM